MINPESGIIEHKHAADGVRRAAEQLNDAIKRLPADVEVEVDVMMYETMGSAPKDLVSVKVKHVI